MLRQRKGSSLIILALVGASIISVITLSLAKSNSVAVSNLKGNRIALQAQQYADAEAQLIKATAYNDLAAKAKTNITNANGFQSEVTLSAESVYSGSIKEKTATVKVYRTGESIPRVTLDVKRYSQELQSGSGVPVGTIIAWPGSSTPTENGTWLLCNGQSCAAYPALCAIVGSTVPNLNGRFLEGTTGTPRIFKEAGLPNIYGTFIVDSNAGVKSGPFYYGAIYGGNGAGGGAKGKLCTFDASLSNAIYGSSDTVQPASYTVRYYIKAA